MNVFSIFFDKILSKIFFYFKINPLQFSIVWTFILILLGFIVCYFKYKVYIIKCPNTMEWCLFDNQFNVLQNSQNFFYILQIDKNRFLENMKHKYIDTYNMICNSLNNKKIIHSFLYSLHVHFEIKIVNDGFLCYFYPCESEFLNSINLPIMIDYNDKNNVAVQKNMNTYLKKTNLSYDMLINNAKKISTQFKGGDFWLYKDFIFVKNEIQSQNTSITIFTPLMPYLDFKLLLHQEKSNVIDKLDFPFLFLQKDCTIKFISQNLIEMFHLTDNVHRIQDILNELRGKILPESLDFNQFKNNIINQIQNITSNQSFILETLVHYKLHIHAIPLKNEILLTFHKTDGSQEYFQQEIKQLIQHLSDFIVIQDYHSNYIDSNFLLHKPKQKISIEKTFTSINEYIDNIVEISLLNKKFKFFIAKQKNNNQLSQVRMMIFESMQQIIKIFNNLSDRCKDQKNYYSNLVKFLIFKIDVDLSLLSITRSIADKSYDFIGFFNNSVDQALEIISFNKNLNIDCAIDKYNTNVNSEILKIILNKIFIICFEYQLADKNLKISNNEQNLHFELQNLPLASKDNIKDFILLIKNSDIVPYYKLNQDSVNFGFHLKFLKI